MGDFFQLKIWNPKLFVYSKKVGVLHGFRGPIRLFLGSKPPICCRWHGIFTHNKNDAQEMFIIGDLHADIHCAKQWVYRRSWVLCEFCIPHPSPINEKRPTKDPKKENKTGCFSLFSRGNNSVSLLNVENDICVYSAQPMADEGAASNRHGESEILWQLPRFTID